ncbi:hypothetical protein KR009_003635, partial [Drosophila setifemur]
EQEQEEDVRQLHKIFEKLEMADQIVLCRTARLLPEACSNLWLATRRRLDFRTLQQEMPLEDQRNHLLGHMMTHFKCVYFVADQLQENLNTLERAGVKSLTAVQRVELLMSGKGRPGTDHPPPQPQPQPQPMPSNSSVDIAPRGMAQWPLHALPKLMRNVRRLKAMCHVQVHFIEHFAHLELLILYGSISQTALTGIFERCQQLERLFLKYSHLSHLNLKAMRNCPKLRDLSVPVGLFARQRDFLMELNHLHLLELTHCGRNVKLTLESLRFIVSRRSGWLEQIQLDCQCFTDPNWMLDVGLERCHRLRGLVLVNCSFGNREISELGMPSVQKYIALNSCHDLKEYQVLDMVRSCPGLRELYLIDCPQLSWKLLQGICRIRKRENLSYPITVVLGKCPELRQDYQNMVGRALPPPPSPIQIPLPLLSFQFSNYWCFKVAFIRIERIQGENQTIEDMQLFFYQNF